MYNWILIKKEDGKIVDKKGKEYEPIKPND